MIKKLIMIALLSASLLASATPKNDQWGVEINPTIPLAWGAIYSMGISYFDHDAAVEYAVPIFTSLKAMGEGDKWQSIHMDFQYKRYHAGVVGDGFYYGGFARWSHLEGYLKETTITASKNKIGIGASIGYRTFGLFGNPSLYWGAGVNVGAYVSGDNDIFENDYFLFGDQPYIVDVEFFKFGMSF